MTVVRDLPVTSGGSVRTGTASWASGMVVRRSTPQRRSPPCRYSSGLARKTFTLRLRSPFRRLPRERGFSTRCRCAPNRPEKRSPSSLRCGGRVAGRLWNSKEHNMGRVRVVSMNCQRSLKTRHGLSLENRPFREGEGSSGRCSSILAGGLVWRINRGDWI